MGLDRMKRRTLLGVAAMLPFAAGRAWAQSDSRQVVQELYDGLRASLRMGANATFQQRFDRLAPVIDRVFDLDTILRVSVGLRWAQLDAATRQTVASIFRIFTIASYAANFDKDGGERFEVLPQVRASGGDQIVQSRLIPGGGDPIRIDYLVRATAMGPRIVDVLLDGSISRVAVQRSDFRGLLVSGDPAPLVDSLRRKVAELSGGTMRP